jgi:DNA-binding beta-propeller fold protein YncE
MFPRRTTLKVQSLVIILAVFAGTAQAKSLYVINNTNTPQLRAYRIDGTSLVYQTDYFCESGTSAVGLAIDESEYGGFLFVTFESFPAKIEIIDAKTMQYVDIVTNTGAYNLAGIVVDKGKRKIYAIDRAYSDGRLFVYSWDAQNRTLTPALPSPYYVNLPGCSYGYGLALDEENGRLYVGDNTNRIKYYTELVESRRS